MKLWLLYCLLPGEDAEKTALSVPNVYEIKTVKQNVFLYVDNDQTQAENIALIKNAIKKKHGDGFVYKVYGVFNGKVDLSQNKTDEEKMKDDYFTLGKKDITDEEVAEFKAKYNL